jgi:hypothetical protein
MKIKRLFSIGIISTLLMVCSSCTLMDDLYHLGETPPPPMNVSPPNGGPNNNPNNNTNRPGGNPNSPNRPR